METKFARLHGVKMKSECIEALQISRCESVMVITSLGIFIKSYGATQNQDFHEAKEQNSREIVLPLLPVPESEPSKILFEEVEPEISAPDVFESAEAREAFINGVMTARNQAAQAEYDRAKKNKPLIEQLVKRQKSLRAHLKKVGIASACLILATVLMAVVI